MAGCRLVTDIFMRWKELVIGAAVTLFVSILAGVVVWLITTYRSAPSASEDLRYTLQNVSTFNVGTSKLGFVSLSATNSGSRVAKDVRLIARFSGGTEIREKELSLSTGGAGQYIENKSEIGLDILLPGLAPKETLKVSLLVSGSGNLVPEVFLRSSETIGVSEKPDAEASKSIFPPYAIVAIIIGALLVQAAGLFLVRRARKNGYARHFNVAPNNTAFLYIQQKLLIAAEQILEFEIQRQGGSSYELANLALVKGLKGAAEEAASRFALAEFYVSSRHGRAVIDYNRATLDISLRNYQSAIRKLEAAFSLSADQVLQYCSISKYVADGMAENLDLKNFLTAKGVVAFGAPNEIKGTVSQEGRMGVQGPLNQNAVEP